MLNQTSIDDTIEKRVYKIISISNSILLENQRNNKKGNTKMQKNLTFKTFSIILGISFIAILSVLFFVGCGGTSPIGEWKLDRIVVSGGTIKSTDTDKGAYASEFENNINLKEGGTGTIKLNNEATTDVTWTQKEKAITITVGQQSEVYILNGTELTYEKGEIKYFYKKG